MLLKISAEDIYEFLLSWAEGHKTEIVNILKSNREEVIKLLSVGRTGDKPRKDLMYCSQIFEFISYFFDEYFEISDSYPENINNEEAEKLLNLYLDSYDHNDDQVQ